MNNLKLPLKRTGGRQVLPVGIYKLKVEKVEPKNGPSGYPYFNFTWRVFFPNGKDTGALIWDIISFAPKARFTVDALLDALKAPEEGEVGISWFRGKVVWATLGTDTYEGAIKNVVKQYLAPEVAQEQLKGADTKGGKGKEVKAEEAFQDSFDALTEIGDQDQESDEFPGVNVAEMEDEDGVVF